MRAPLVFCGSSLLLCILAATAADAQESPSPGVRAAGMGGAFTAVADDASAVFWNPAGLAGGSFFSLVLDRNSHDDGSATLIGLGTPPLGLSYYRTATADRANGRNSLVAHHVGVTLLQSLADRLAVGATVKVVRGVVTSGPGTAVSTNKFDADLGIMAMGSLGQLGLTVHNVMQPEFAGTLGAVQLKRRVRAGISLKVGTITTIAADADLAGERRQAALGAETHPLRSAWLRGGVHWNTTGDTSAPIGSVGGSYALYGSTVADAQVSFGSKKGNRSWGVGLRFLF